MVVGLTVRLRDERLSEVVNHVHSLLLADLTSSVVLRPDNQVVASGLLAIPLGDCLTAAQMSVSARNSSPIVKI